MPATSSGRGPYVFVEDLERPALDDGDHHHLARVLRLGRGEPVVASDGAGRWRQCRFGARLEVNGPVREEARSEPPLTVGFALVKGARPELVVQKLTELGVDVIVPFHGDRSVVHWNEPRSERNLERLVKVSREAAMQSRRSWLPEVVAPCSFAEAAHLPGARLCDPSGEPPSLEHPTLLVGPEGGWAEHERAALPAVRLGPRVLRAETAAIAAGALLAALRDGLIAHPVPG